MVFDRFKTVREGFRAGVLQHSAIGIPRNACWVRSGGFIKVG